ncbi:MAG: MG2 domain-containing protein [Castellaniella sp.]
MRKVAWLLMMGLAGMLPAWAVQVSEFVPQGEVATIDSVQISFDDDMVPFGDAQLPAPLTLSCSGGEAGGAGRWLDSRRWIYEFNNRLPAGVQCQAALLPDLRSLDGEAIQGQSGFSFGTGAPRLIASRPYDSPIAEDQVFVLRFNGPVQAQSLRENSRCVVEGIGEAIPVRLVAGQQREQVLDTFWDSRFDATQSTHLLQCMRLLPAEAQMRLEIGPGVASVIDAGSDAPLVTQEAEVLEYTVRPVFTAELSCGRENARAPCSPLQSLGLRFSSPVPRATAADIRLQLPGGEYSPDLGDPEDDWPLTWVGFPGPFPANVDAVLHLPSGVHDDAGRQLVNAPAFPLAFRIGDYPPLVKFASEAFGVVERFAAVPPGAKEDDHPPTLPLSLRYVEGDLLTRALLQSAGTVRDQVIRDDREVLRWYARVQRLRYGHWSPAQFEAIRRLAPVPEAQQDDSLRDVRSYSLLTDMPEVHRIVLPGAQADVVRPSEVIGVPVAEPGLHVLEIESPRLGAGLLEDARPMFVRNLALVTNLSVHLKLGRDDALVWVTTLDDAQVVADADVTILDCRGLRLARGRTDARGLLHLRRTLPRDDYCEDTGLSGVFASARIDAGHPLARGKADFAFVLSSWDDGIEGWRFNLPMDMDVDPTRRVHTVFDRSLFRAGETVSMKHFLRLETRDGLAVPQTGLPDAVLVSLFGATEAVRIPLEWQETPSGGLSAYSTFVLPETAPLGSYRVQVTDSKRRWYGSSVFQVEAFRLPVLGGALQLQGQDQGEGQGGPLVAPDAVALDVQVNYLTGGPAARLPVSLSALTQDRMPWFEAFEDYAFDRPSPLDEAAHDAAPRLFLDKQSVQLDAHGGARVMLASPADLDYPQQWTLEASFIDPSGELQTLAHSAHVWPADIQPGIKTESWFAAADQPVAVRVVALGRDGQPRAGVPVTVSGLQHKVYTTRKRLVGGFYSYDNQRQSESLGILCEGVTGDDGRFACAARVDMEGRLELVATVQDEQGRKASSATQTWISGSMAAWFGASDDDRIDIIPARTGWAVGEMAEFQVRMPFREATALVSVEREGVLQTWVQTLAAADPVIRVPVQAQWAPNVYVSVLVLRGRLRGDGTAPAPGTVIDLAKPSFRFGVATLRVPQDQHRLLVNVQADRSRYQVGDRVSVDIQVHRTDGRPAAGGSVAFAAVDAALLELAPNPSWDALQAMYPVRGYGVSTATAQMQVVGRRHYGRKAVPAGGGGGASPTRELLDTLLSWQPDVRLDDQGRARVTFRLNDAITRFELVAVADHGSDGFGTGRTDIVSARDLYLISGLPTRVRQGDRYQAEFTVRNTTGRVMPVSANIQVRDADGRPLAGFPESRQERLELAPGAAQRLRFPVRVPADAGLAQARDVTWTVRVSEEGAPDDETRAGDALKILQRVGPLVPVQVQQAGARVLAHHQPEIFAVAAPQGALRDDHGVLLGGIQLDASAGPQAGLDGVRRWFSEFDHDGLPQRVSRLIAMSDETGWSELMDVLPRYMDDDGLVAAYPRTVYSTPVGSEVLTAWLLSISDDALALGGRFSIPETRREAMLEALQAFVEGRIVRYRRAPVKDLDMRKLMAMEALSRYARLHPRLLGTVSSDPQLWHTSALIDAIGVLQRVPGVSARRESVERLTQIVKSRSVLSGRTRVLTDSALNASAWMMTSTIVNQARLASASLNWPDWEDERQPLLQGLIDMQRRGHWGSSTANVYGTLALRAYDAAYPARDVRGEVNAHDSAGKVLQSLALDGAGPAEAALAHAPLMAWESVRADTSGAGHDWLDLRYQGAGKPWVSVQALAAVRHSTPLSAGLQISRSVQPLMQARPGQWSQGDTYRVRLTLQTSTPRFWVTLSDAIPSGARILGAGLGRDSALPVAPAPTAEQDSGWWPTHVERREDAYVATYEVLPGGTTVLDYVVRLNTAGTFFLPPTRAEALYQPDVHAEWPIDAPMHVLEYAD